MISTVEEEIIVGGNGSQEVVVKSRPPKLKLENVSSAQWSVANLAILYKLVEEGKLHEGYILDYLSFNPADYSGHSKRRGGMNFALQCGILTEWIKLQGGWVSNAYERYVSLAFS